MTVMEQTGVKKKSEAAFRTIGEVAAELELPQHVLRFWETKFSRIRPHKRRGGHRYYRPADVELLKEIKALLYEKGFTIKGAQKYLEENRSETPAMSYSGKEATAQRPRRELNEKQVERLHHVKSELDELKKLLHSELTDA